MKIERNVEKLELLSVDGSLTVMYGNSGEPFREGVSMEVKTEDEWVRVLLDYHDVKCLRNKLSEYLGD